jgi:hypothetical protein
MNKNTLEAYNISVYRRGELCDHCQNNKKLPQYYIQTPSYYRNKVGGDYFFCSSDCMGKFENEKVCKHCHYYGNKEDLQQPTGENFKLCTNYPGDRSCYEKYMQKKFPELVTQCAFCRTYDDLNFQRTLGEKTHKCCENCLNIYKSIVLDNLEENGWNICVFCNVSAHGYKRVNGRVMCGHCVDVYKIFVGLEN